MLAATALGLGCCPVGAFFDDEVESLVGVDGIEEVALYLASVGPLP
jgi:nitroreductase